MTLIPSFPEQQKIAAFLSSLDDLIAAHNRKLEVLKKYKKGLMQLLFPVERETVSKLRFSKFWNLGEWGERALGDCLMDAPAYGMNAPAVPYSDQLPTYLRITDISEDGYFLADQKKSIAVNVYPNDYLLDGDIVLVRTGASVGKSYRYRIKDGALVFAGFLIRIRPDRGIVDPGFVSQFLTTERYWKWVEKNSARSGQPGINGNEYASLLIPLPSIGDIRTSLAEQKHIAFFLSSLDDLIAAQTAKIDELREHKKGLIRDLFPVEDRTAE
jgi:type I restriction enzyme, S subunit